jgi:cephalosporin-C deacetylase-like acetyl esterase
MSAEYFRLETARLAETCLADVKSLEDWTARREEYRHQLFDMLGLNPMPDKTDLSPHVTGNVEHESFTIEKLHYQSMPGLYVTANLYLPKGLTGPAPAILYVCGHSRVVKDGVSYGNKAGYQHHAAWFARNGYVCLVLDSLQLGEIEATHHGTYGVRRDNAFEQMWWWNCRGYSPAGVEAWNCIRALDYLQSRPEVDGEKLGVTGRSGGGAYSWWIAALDERIKAAVPVAGITDLENHVVDGCVEGHCDCMYVVNTFEWDYPLVAALVAPRPLLITNSDKDTIFPLDGVVRLHEKVRSIYSLFGAADKLGLQISEGPHKDTQELQIAAFHWFNRFLKGEDPQIEMATVKLFEPEQLKVFESLPADQINTRIHDSFVPLAEPAIPPANRETWQIQRDAWRQRLLELTFRGWPGESEALDVHKVNVLRNGDYTLSVYEFTSQVPFRLPLFLLSAGSESPTELELDCLDEESWQGFVRGIRARFPEAIQDGAAGPPDPQAFEWLSRSLVGRPAARAFVAVRGIGPTACDPSERKQTQIKRRYMLLGQTLDGMRVWDIRRTITAVGEIEGIQGARLILSGRGTMGGTALYAAVFERDVDALRLHHLPRSHMEGPNLLNVLRVIDLPQAVALVADRAEVQLVLPDASGWDYPLAVAQTMEWGDDRLRVMVEGQ